MYQFRPQNAVDYTTMMGKASPTDGSRKRRSFLPAPKKSSASAPSPTSPRSGQPSFPPAHPPSHHQQPSYQYQPPQQSPYQQLHQSSQQSYHQQSPYQHPHQLSHQHHHQFQQPPPVATATASYSAYTTSYAHVPTGSSVDDPREVSRSRSADSSRRGGSKGGGGGGGGGTSAPVFGRGLRVGSRIKISGVKQGILRYIGTTHLAPGIFCGIELLESDGCHDGEVNGHRYFSCPPNHGIFAPKEKVCLDPAFETLNRVASDSDGTYSSSESLTERSYKAFKDFEEPEIEAIDYTTLSPESSFHEALQRGDEAAKRHYRNLRAYAKAKLSSTSSVADQDKSPEYQEPAQASHDSHRRGRSGLPKASGKTSQLPGPGGSSSALSKLPSYSSRSYTKLDDQDAFSSHASKASLYSSLPCEGQYQYHRSEHEGQRLDSTYVLDSRSQHESCEPPPFQKFRAAAATRSSDESEEDGGVRDTTLSTDIKKQLRADSRQYLNFTFDPEELNRSLDDSGSDSNTSRDRFVRDRPEFHSAHHRPGYNRVVSASECSEESSLGVLSPTTLSANTLSTSPYPGDPREIWHGDDSRRLTSTPVSGTRLVQSGSYTVVSHEERLQAGLDRSRSSSEYAECVGETTRSISDSDIPQELLPGFVMTSEQGSPSSAFPQVGSSVDDDVGDAGSDQGGYAGESNGGGHSVGLPLSRTLDSTSSDSTARGAEVSQSRSYTVCSTEGPQTSPSFINKDSTGVAVAGACAVVTSASYTLVKSDSATSSPSHKGRKISSASSCETTGGDSSSSGTEPKTDSSDPNGGTMDDSSSGPSPEVSQALEWDYGQEFEGKLPLGRQDNTMTTSASTGTSDSLSDVLRDMSENSDGQSEIDSASGVADDSDSQFETPDNDFENIDSLEDFPIFGKDAKAIMTDSGISDKDFDSSAKSTSSTVCGNSSDDCSREDDNSSHRTARAISSDSSQETLAVADTPGSVEEKELPRDDICYTASSNVLDVEVDRSRKDSFEEGNNSSPASVVSVEDADMEKTIMSDVKATPRENTAVVIHASGVCRKEGHAPGHNKTRPESGIEDSEVEEGSLPDSNTSLEMEELTPRPGYGDFEEPSAARKERPVSLLSTTSADTGYVPDTDSDMGTLTTNSPCDYTDRLGLEHQPFGAMDIPDDLGTDMDLDLKDPVAPPTTDQLVPPFTDKTGDDDDVSVDMTSQTEDDRIEADQLNGPLDDDATPRPEPPANEVKVEGQEQAEEGTSQKVDGKSSEANTEGQKADTAPVESGSPAKEGTPATEKGRKGSKDSSLEPEAKKPKKKPFKMTKKKMEVIDHKLPNTKVVASRLADYIKAPPPPPPPKAKEEEENKKKTNVKANAKTAKKNNTEAGNKTMRSASIDKGRDTSLEPEREKPPKVEKPKPVIIKRTPPKSKWGDIMSQIGSNKETTKAKPKSEVKSSLAEYLNSPLPQKPKDADPNDPVAVNNAKNDEQNQKVVKREPKPSRIKPLPPPPPKIDLSKVKSKLNVPTAASAIKAMPKRESSPSNAGPKNKQIKAQRDGSLAGKGVTKDIVLVRQSLSEVSSVRSSRTDLSFAATTEDGQPDGEDGVSSKRGSVDLTKKSSRRLSTRSERPAETSQKNKELTRRRSEVKTTSNSLSNKPGDPRAAEIRQQAPPSRSRNSSVSSSHRSSASPTPVILKPVKPRPKSAAIPPGVGNGTAGGGTPPSAPRTTIVISSKQAWGANGKPNTVLIKGRDSIGNHAKRSNKANGSVRSNGAVPSHTTASSGSTNNNNRGGPAAASAQASQKEIHRLGSLCEARTKELTQTKMQLRATAQAFDAMAVVVNYCCAELNAFECPELAEKLDKVQKQLTGCLSHIADLTSEKEKLTQEVTELSQANQQADHRAQEASSQAQTQQQEHQRIQQDLEDTHNAALTTQRDELTAKHTESVKKLHECHDKEINLQKHSFDRQIQDVQNEQKLELNRIRISHLEEIQELRNKHDQQMEELHKQHRNKLEDITHRFESIKLTLSEKVESLRGECDDLRHRARNSEDALQRDADVKVQMALAPYLALPKEIESLRTVVEMRNEEIQKLRTKNMDLEKQLEEVPIAREKIISQKQKIENLEAIINIKTDHEKQMHEKCQVLMRKYDRESRANKRLSMDYEQVVWRMSQSQELSGSSESLTKRQVSRSPPRSETTSPDPRRRCLSPGQHGEVVMRTKKRSSHSSCGVEGEYKLRSRSATFVLEKKEEESGGESRSCSSSPQAKNKRWKKLSQGDGDGDNGDETRGRMCQSATAEILVQCDKTTSGGGDGEDKLNDTFELQPDSLTSTGEMIHSYARSISGVSDSGVYDSLTRSELLNSSILSTDSEWAASGGQMSMTTDMDDLNMTQGSGGDRTVTQDPSPPANPTAQSSEHENNYQFQISLPGEGPADTSLDNVFNDDQHEDASLDSCTFSLENTDGATNSRLTSVSEDFSLQEDDGGANEKTS